MAQYSPIQRIDLDYNELQQAMQRGQRLRSQAARGIWDHARQSMRSGGLKVYTLIHATWRDKFHKQPATVVN